jgi:hypothetical protein
MMSDSVFETGCPICRAPVKAKHCDFNYEVRAGLRGEETSIHISALFTAASIDDAVAQFNALDWPHKSYWKITAVYQVDHRLTVMAGERLGRTRIARS